MKLTDLQMMALCAEALGIALVEPDGTNFVRLKGKKLFLRIDAPSYDEYNPLDDGAQAWELVTALKLHIDQRPGKQVSVQDPHFEFIVEKNKKDGDDLNLNRAVVELVAKYWAAFKKKS